MGKGRGKGGAAMEASCIGALALLLLIFASMSFKRVHTLDMALDYDTLFQKVSDQSLSNGLHFLGGPWHRVITYPKVRTERGREQAG